MNIYRAWSDEIAAEAIRMHKEGIPAAVIGRKIGKNPSAVRTWLDSRGYGRKGDLSIASTRFWRKEQQELAIRLHNQRVSYEEIGKRIGKSKAAVKRWFYYERRQKSYRLASLNIVDRKPVIPQEVLDDRDRRMAQEQTLHMLLLGDPVPCQSALNSLRKV